MFSFQLITANNGWAMALAGALIVMSGLTVLSFIISQLHRLVELTEKKTSAPEGKPEIPEKFPDDIAEVARYYEPLIKQLPGSFSLNELFALTSEKKFPHPHLTLRSFRQAGLLVPQGDGMFTWKSTT